MAKEIKAGVKITGKDDSKGAFASLSHSFSQTDKKFQAMQKSMSGVASGAGMAFRGLAIAGAAVSGATIGFGAAVWSAVKSANDYIDGLDDMAQVAGLTAPVLDRLNYIFKLNGIEPEVASVAFKKFAKSMLEIHRPGDGVYKSLRKISPEFAKMIKGADGNSDALLKTMSALAGMQNQTKKNALAQTLFGKSALDVLVVLNKGPQAYKELTDEAAKNSVVTDEAVAASGAFGDSMDRLNKAAQGLKAAFGIQLMPALTESAEALSNFVSENRVEIVRAFSGVVKTLGDGIKNAVKYLTDNPDAFKNFIGSAASEIQKALELFREVRDAIDFIRGEQNRQDKALRGRQIQGFIPTPTEAKSGFASASRFGGDKGFMGATGQDAVVGRGITALGFRGGMGMMGLAAGMTNVVQPEMKLVVDFRNVPRDIEPRVETSDPRVKVSEGTPSYFTPGAFE